MYIELHAASAFSFLQGASLPETLVERAAALDYPALALLDADGVYGAPRFHKAAKQAGLKAIIGAELTIREAGRAGKAGEWRLPVLIESQAGYQNLCRLVTRMKMRAAKGEGALAIDELEGFTTGLVALAGRPMLNASRHGVGGLLDRVVGLFGRRSVFVELQRHLMRDEEADNVALDSLARAFGVPTIATNDVRFAETSDRPLFDVLTCVRHKTTLDAAGRKLARNAERYLKSPQAMARLFADRPAALASTLALAERLEYTMADLGYRFPKYPVPDGETEMSFLHHITDAGARERYRPYHDKARVQIARELALIEKLELAGYFLIVWDIVNYCRQQDILVQGRGSAANSAVCYSLGITAVDPIKMDLLFERFLSEERGEWPDIDLDLPSGDRRERVIQHVYEKYGRLGAAMTANVITYRSRSAAREVGKALSLDDDDVDRLAKVMNNFEFTDPNDTLGRHVAEAGMTLSMPRMKQFADLWLAVQDLPRHLGQHSGGMVICQGELDSVVPLEPASMPGRVVIQWDKDDCADMGIVKVDLLGLGMMAALQDAIELVNTSTNPKSQTPNPKPQFDLAHIPMDDAKVYEMLQKAETIGVFQVESRAQMATLPRLKPTHFYDLVVEVAIIRPGPIVGDMVHPYLNRRAGREPVVPLHPCLEPILKRTLGVPLFQEQLLRMAMAAAGFTGGQAEELRRAMGFKRSEKRMKQIEVQLREGMARNGITGETAERIIGSITSFALYGFPESHAASFALLAYASAYLKVHYPAAFYTALLNNQPMGFYHPASLVKDAQRRGVRFHPIDVQQSDWLCRVEEDGAIRLGLMYVNGLRKEAGQAMAAFDRTKTVVPPVLCAKCGSDDESMIEVVRNTHAARTYFCNTCAHEWTVQLRPVGRFASIEQVVQRTGLRRDELTTLADIGALNDFTHERRSALWQVERAVRPAGELYEEDKSQIPNPKSQIPNQLPTTNHPRPTGGEPASTDGRGRAAACGLRRHGADDRAASDGAAARRPRAARRAARRRSAVGARRAARACRGHGDHAPAPRHRERIRLPHARGRDRRLEHHRPAGSLRSREDDRHPPAVPARRGRAAAAGRRAVGEGGTRAGNRRGRVGGRPRFLLAVSCSCKLIPALNPLRIAFLGCGFITRVHSRHLRSLRSDFTCSYASRDRAKADAYCREFGGARAYGDYAAAIEDPDIDAIVIAVPPRYHLMLSLAALAARKHVLVEKPAYLTLEDYETVLAARDRSGRAVLVGENDHYKPLAVRLRALVAEGVIGEMVFVHFTTIAKKFKTADDWRNDEAMAGGDAFFEEGIHWLHLANSLGPRIVDIRGFRPPVSREGADRRAKSMMVAFTYDSGAVGSLYYSREIPSLLRGVRLSKLFGRKGIITFESNGAFVLVRGEGMPRLQFPGFADIRGYQAMYRDFARSIREARQPEMSLETAIADHHLMEQIYQWPTVST